MKIQETSEDITKWKSFVQSLKINFKEENTQKDQEKYKITLKEGACTSCIIPCTPTSHNLTSL